MRSVLLAVSTSATITRLSGAVCANTSIHQGRTNANSAGFSTTKTGRNAGATGRSISFMEKVLMDLGTYLLIWDKDDNCYHSDKRHLSRLGDAVSACLDTGRDSLIQLTALSGDVYVLRASNINAWQVTTPDGRRREVEMQIALEFEAETIKQELGIWDEDE